MRRFLKIMFVLLVFVVLFLPCSAQEQEAGKNNLQIEELRSDLESAELRSYLFLTLLAVSIGLLLWYRNKAKSTKSLTGKMKMQNCQLESVNKLFTNFLDQSIEAFTVFDTEGQVILWNKANERISGIKQESAIGRYVWDIGAKIKMIAFNSDQDQERERLEKFFRKLIQNPEFEAKTDEVMIERENGEIRTLEATYFPVKISRSTYFGIILWDITEQKEYEGQLIIAKEQAESSDKLKSEFLAQISHEIRTPISTIVNHSSLIDFELQDLDMPTISDSITSISKAGQRIIRTIDLLIDISALHTGSYEMQPKQLDLIKDILEPCYKEYEGEAQNKGLEFNLNRNGSDLPILADEKSAVQIINNLVSNAIIFTEEGSVDINSGKDKFGRVFFEIADTGIGIDRNFLSKIYDPFSQEEQGYTRKYEGNGLGLTLVKEYCELNDAVIKVKSAKGEGTTFRITFNQPDLDFLKGS